MEILLLSVHLVDRIIYIMSIFHRLHLVYLVNRIYMSPPPPYIYIYIYIRTEFYAVSSPPPGVAKNGRRRNFDWRMERMKLKQMDLFSEINYKRRYWVSGLVEYRQNDGYDLDGEKGRRTDPP